MDLRNLIRVGLGLGPVTVPSLFSQRGLLRHICLSQGEVSDQRSFLRLAAEGQDQGASRSGVGEGLFLLKTTVFLHLAWQRAEREEAALRSMFLQGC